MIRRGFTMTLKPGALPQYRQYHDEIWPELLEEIKRSGVRQITIFEDDPVLFVYSEVEDEGAWDRLWHTPIHQKWAEVMQPLLEFGPDGLVKSKPVNEVFHMRA